MKRFMKGISGYLIYGYLLTFSFLMANNYNDYLEPTLLETVKNIAFYSVIFTPVGMLVAMFIIYALIPLVYEVIRGSIGQKIMSGIVIAAIIKIFLEIIKII